MEKAIAPHSSVLAWRIPGTAEPGGLPSMGSHRVGHNWSDLAAAAAAAVTAMYQSLLFWNRSIYCGLCASTVVHSCLTLCDPMDCSLPGSSVREIFQARILEWVAISFSRGSSQPKDQVQISCTSRWILYLWATWNWSYLTIAYWMHVWANVCSFWLFSESERFTHGESHTGLKIPDFKLDVLTGMRFLGPKIRDETFYMWEKCE